MNIINIDIYLIFRFLCSNISFICENLTCKGCDMFVELLDEMIGAGKMSFTLPEIIQKLDISYNAAICGIYSLKKKGKIISPSKGFYVIVPTEYKALGSLPARELALLLMKHLKADYYVSLLSAAEFYGAAHQKSNKLQVITNKIHKHDLKFGSVQIKLLLKKNLENLPMESFVINTGSLNVSSPELTAIDLVKYSYQCGGLNHIATVLSELTESMNENKIIALTKIIRERSCFQRLGYILETIFSPEEEEYKIAEALYKAIKNDIKRYIPIVSEVNAENSNRNRKWKIIENASIESDL